MDVCLLAAGKLVQLGALSLTLAWSHSVQHTRWEEDWRLTSSGLVLDEARVEGSGAGMEPGAGASYDGRVWRWQPKQPPQQDIVLRRSGATADWQICRNGICQALSDLVPADADPVVVKGCP